MKKLSKAKKREIRRFMILGLSVIIVMVAVICIGYKIIMAFYNHTHKETGMVNIDYSDYNVPKPDIIDMLLTKNKNSRPGTALKNVNGIVIHYTANPGTDAEANRNYFEGRKNEADISENKVSSHFIIGLDGKIIQCIPLNEIAYASNDRNSDTISIECCHPDSSGKFSKKTYSSLVHLSAWLCGKFHLGRADIIRHYDVTGKMCPLYYVKHEDAWLSLKKSIWKYFLRYKTDSK